MLCQNCGRRSSDKYSFCTNCGAVASPDSPGLSMSVMSGPPVSMPTIVAPSRPARSAQPRPQKAKARTTYQQTRSQGGSGFSTIVFLAIVFGMAWWFTKTDDFDLITFIRQAIESAIDQSRQSSSPPPQPARPAATPARPATTAAPTATAPATAGRRTKDSLPAAGDKGPTVPNLQYRGTAAEIDGLTEAQVQQRFGAPTRRVAGGDGVNVWFFQNPDGGGPLIVYFYKGRASLKPPR